MNILLSTNNYYVMPTLVLLQSLFEHAEEKMDIYLYPQALAHILFGCVCGTEWSIFI